MKKHEMNVFERLNVAQKTLHLRAKKLCRQYRELEWPIVEVLQEVERTNLFKQFKRSSVYQYAIHELELTESVAYSFIGVARKAAEIPELREALKKTELSAYMASRITAALTKENAAEVVEFARKHTTREVDFEVARRNPRAAAREHVKILSEDQVQVTMIMSRQSFEDLKRSQTLESQKGDKNIGMGATAGVALREHLKRVDPVIKAQRAVQKKVSQTAVQQEAGARKTTTRETAQQQGRVPELCARRVSADNLKPKPDHKERGGRNSRRVRLKAAEKHEVIHRDGGRCTFVHPDGQRCPNERWLQIHHKLPVSHGGDNSLGNLATLCGFHHDLVHQLALPIEGQVTWLR